MNSNICEKCIDTKPTPSIVVADTGVCGKCGETNEVWDLEVIHLYKKSGLSDEKIWKYLPRLRSSHSPSETGRNHSLSEIQEKLADLILIE